MYNFTKLKNIFIYIKYGKFLKNTLAWCSVMAADSLAASDGSWCPFCSLDCQATPASFRASAMADQQFHQLLYYKFPRRLLVKTGHMAHFRTISIQSGGHFWQFLSGFRPNIPTTLPQCSTRNVKVQLLTIHQQFYPLFLLYKVLKQHDHVRYTENAKQR